MVTVQVQQQHPFYGPLIQDNPGEPVLSQRNDLLEQPLDFYEPDVLPVTQPTEYIKALQENPVVWSVIFCFIHMLSYRWLGGLLVERRTSVSQIPG